MTDHPEVMHLLFEKGTFLGAFTNAGAARRLKEAREARGNGPIKYLTYCKQGQENGEFNPDWSMLKAAHENMRDYSKIIRSVDILVERAATDRSYDGNLIDDIRDILDGRTRTDEVASSGKAKYRFCEPHGRFPCRDCGITHFDGCECPYCVSQKVVGSNG